MKPEPSGLIAQANRQSSEELCKLIRGSELTRPLVESLVLVLRLITALEVLRL